MNVRAVEIAEQVGHPIIDADGHILEFTPAALPYLREAMGSERPRLSTTQTSLPAA